MKWINMLMPEGVQIVKETQTASYAELVIAPLERGFAHTLGTALRRTLLSSIHGHSITAVQIDGVKHELSTLPFVLEDMTDIVLEHHGTVVTFIGDAIMAFWGAPVDDPDHAKNAVLTGLEMHVALHELNKDLVARGWPELKIGVGVNTGPMTVGDMGSPVRQSYTVMGDAVNLGSRLEGITKQYGVGFIVGEGTRELLKKDFVFRELDRVRVKGKEDPVGIYEPVGEEGKVAREEMDEIKLWNQALRAYRAQDWDQAELALMNLQRMKPRYLYDLYVKRVEHLRKEPPGENWDGVTVFETK